MNRLLRVALHLYPGSWRRRYGAELEALIEDSQPGWRAAVDVARGALAMRLRSAPAILLLGTLGGTAAGSALYVWSPLVHTTTSIVEVTGTDLRRAWNDLTRPNEGGRTRLSGAGTLAAIDFDGSALMITTIGREAPSSRDGNARDVARIIETAETYANGTEPFSFRVTHRGDASSKSRGAGTVLVSSAIGLLLAGLTLRVRRAQPEPFSLLGR